MEEARAEGAMEVVVTVAATVAAARAAAAMAVVKGVVARGVARGGQLPTRPAAMPRTHKPHGHAQVATPSARRG